MAITYPLAVPASPRAANVSLRPATIVSKSESIFTGETKVLVHQGQWWEADINYPIMTRADAEPLVSWTLKLNGIEGTFLMGDPANPTNRGTCSSAPGTPLVNGASQTGTSLICDGAPINSTGYLKAGDYVQLGSSANSRLYKVLSNADSDASGNFTIDVWPKVTLGNSPANNDPLTVSNAVGIFRMTRNNMIWGISPGKFYEFAFSAKSDP